MNHTVKFFTALVVILMLLAVGPLVTIWALNTVFAQLAIPYTIETWAAVIVLKCLLTVRMTGAGSPL